MTIDERIQALTMNLELAMRDIEALIPRQEQNAKEIAALQLLARQDGENIRGLVRIAEIHERRLTALEGDEQ
jgi:hypothetical protein